MGIIHGALKPLTSCTGFLPQVNYPYRVLTRRDEHRPERERRELMAACWFSRGTIGIVGYILEFHRDNGKEHGNYFMIIGYILRLYSDTGKENGK